MKLRIGKPAIAPQADEPIAPLQKSAVPGPFSKLLRAANDEPRPTVWKPQASGLPANDPAREVPLLTVAHGPLQPPPNPGRRASDVVKTPSSERGLVERLRVVSEPKAEAPPAHRIETKPTPQPIANGRRASDLPVPVPKPPNAAEQPPIVATKSAPAQVDAKATTADARIVPSQPKPHEIVLSTVLQPVVQDEPAPVKAATATKVAQPDVPRVIAQQRGPPTAVLNTQPIIEPPPAVHPQSNTARPNIDVSSTEQLPRATQPRANVAQPAKAVLTTEQPTPTRLPSVAPTAEATRTAHSNTTEATRAVQPHSNAPRSNVEPLLTEQRTTAVPSSLPQPQARTTSAAPKTNVSLEQPASKVVTEQPPTTPNPRIVEPNVPTPRAPITSQKSPQASQPTTFATPTPVESPRPDPKPIAAPHRRRVIDSNVQEKPHTEKNAPAQSPTAPLVTTSNTSFVAAPEIRLVARASPDTLAAPSPQEFAHRPSSTVRDEATPTPTHAPALREPPAIAATLFSVSPTVTATAVDTKHFVTASQPLKAQATTTAPMARHAAEQRPNAQPAREQGHVAQVLQFAAQRTTKPTEPDKNASVEAPAQRKTERAVETKKSSEPERDDKTVTPLPTQPAPLQPTDLPPPQRVAEASAPQQPNPLPNVAPAYLDDPSLRVVVLPNIARLSVETQDSGTLSLQVKVHDGVTDIRAAGPAASLVEARQGELRLALAHEGLALGHFDLTQSDHQGAPQHHFEPHDEREALPHRAHVRSESSSSTTRAEGRLSVKA